jgi:LPXTG-motif cell wall-anchored protein
MNIVATRWRPAIAALAAIALLALLASVARAAPAAQGGTVIQMGDNFFQPAQVTVPAGATVTWRNGGQRPHTATANNRAFDTGTVQPGAEASVTLANPGTYDYFCQFHDGMVGTIVVQAAQTQPSPSPASPSPSPASPSPAAVTPMVEASDQRIVDNSVTVARVVAAQDGWIVIHTNTAENRPGPVIGQSPVKAGENANVRVQLSQTPQPGDKLWPMLHIDAGTIGTYEFPGADGPVQANGMVVMVQITVLGDQAQAPAASPVAAPPASLPETGADQGAWIALFGLAALLLIAGATLTLRESRRRA